jgi:hypothetical protein
VYYLYQSQPTHAVSFPKIEMRRKFRPYFVDVDEKGVEHNKATKWIYDVLSVIVTTWSLSYIFSSFIVSQTKVNAELDLLKLHKFSWNQY